MSYDRHIVLPAIRGIQARHEYFAAMVRIRFLERLVFIDPASIHEPGLRAQRTLTKGRIPQIRDYIVKNPSEYILPALTLTVDSEVEFEPASTSPRLYSVGTLKVPTSAKFLVNDGQHRLAGIRSALKEYPELADETISCVLFVDTGLRRAQTVFADLNKHALRPSRSLCILYDYSDPLAEITRRLVSDVPLFARLTDVERSSIPTASSRLFTLSGLYRATSELLPDHRTAEVARFVQEFWSHVGQNLPEWQLVEQGEIPAAAVREKYIHCCTLGLVGIGRAGRTLLISDPHGWRDRLGSLSNLDWNRDNLVVWEGRATSGGRISTSRGNEILVGDRIKMALGLPLDPDEVAAEAALQQARESRATGEVRVQRYAD